MDVCLIDLPSHRGTFVLPMKVYRNRFRKDNEAYFPDIECETDNQLKLEELILKRGFIQRVSQKLLKVKK
jgi:hypothetical protein